MQLLPFDACDDLRVDADVKRTGKRLEFTYKLSGDTADVVIPLPAPPERTDGLWQATCFEAFVSLGKSSYAELNFAPSGQWAAYRFTNYRQGMRQLDIESPKITFADNMLTAVVEIKAEAGALLNLSAVIERRNGSRSYWALAHPKSNRPDFHTRDCFVAKLP
jgi:hypothetical protein